MSAMPESQALMVGMDSDSNSDTTEFVPLGTNGRFQPVNRIHAFRSGKWNPCGKGLSWALTLSGAINVALVVVLLVVSSHKVPSACQDFPSLSEHAYQTESDSSSSVVSTSSTLSSSLSSQPSSTTATPPSSPSHTLGSTPMPSTFTCVTSSSKCGEGTERVQAPKDPGYVNVFQDLSQEEISAVVQYLLRQPSLNLRLNAEHGNRVFGVELYIPAKASALKFLDSSMSQPPREALVSLILEEESPPVFRQYVVGPLPQPFYHHVNPRMNKNVPLTFLDEYRVVEVLVFAYQQVRQAEVDTVLRHSLGLTPSDCLLDLFSRPCVQFNVQKMSSGLVNTTTFVIQASYNAEFVVINAVPFQLIITEASTGQYAIRSVFYGGYTFSSLPELVARYNDGTIVKVFRTYPQNVPGETSIRGSMHLRGEPFPRVPHPPPRQYEPKGHRYSVVDQHIKYLEWSFNVRNSVESGPQIWDVRWSGERIVYELSLQEIAVFYAGAAPYLMFTHLSDSAFGLGDNAKPLVPGVDCPDHAQFLSTWIYDRSAAAGSRTREMHNSVCVFEHNSAVPLRRHSFSYSGASRNYYGGVVDHYLVVRSVIVEYNYDYIMDFVFHSNGALETRVYATGYIFSQGYTSKEEPFGFMVNEGIVGSIHHHLFNFKVDMDVCGVSNRYETLDFAIDDRDWPWLSLLRPSATSSSSSLSSSSSPSSSSSSSTSSSRSFQQLSFKHHVRQTEQDALYHYNFDHPKYHVFYNHENKNRFGNARSYRMEVRGYSKQLLPSDHPALRSRRWADYCMAVTERKEGEMKSSSIFSKQDANDPVVNFEDFVADNDSIVDKDLVSWVTVGMHHLPHTEDIPNTPTLGTEASILLLPYNYFPECPTVRSRDAVRIDRISGEHETRFTTYGTQRDFTCTPPAYGWFNASSNPVFP